MSPSRLDSAGTVGLPVLAGVSDPDRQGDIEPLLHNGGEEGCVWIQEIPKGVSWDDHALKMIPSDGWKTTATQFKED